MKKKEEETLETWRKKRPFYKVPYVSFCRKSIKINLGTKPNYCRQLKSEALEPYSKFGKQKPRRFAGDTSEATSLFPCLAHELPILLCLETCKITPHFIDDMSKYYFHTTSRYNIRGKWRINSAPNNSEGQVTRD